jgi:hypothetical protein
VLEPPLLEPPDDELLVVELDPQAASPMDAATTIATALMVFNFFSFTLRSPESVRIRPGRC